ncbi:pseudouridine-5'-phosphatase [Rhipicephalus sanguineus]|uniref:pseudouridine-5'-phosphatase n=1 Tax=Rhipicephalus sanguineus TaxID=34632 RepID=UPI001896151D|nr:pseudouridine-5'-phosphatase [Rhipicephalus sanguineus]
MAAKFKPVTHVIFDLDGVVLDTEKIHEEAVQSIASRYGKKYTWELKVKLLGTTGPDSARMVIDGLNLPLTVDDYLADLGRIYAEKYPKVDLMPGVDRLVRHLHKHGIPMAIATSSKRVCVTMKTVRHKDLFALFQHVVCAGDNPKVKRGKPHPDIFLITASEFDGKPPSEKVLVFEDAPNGVTAALAAGMQVVMIPDPRMDEANKRRATMWVDSLTKFKPELFGLPPFEETGKKSSPDDEKKAP